MYFNDQNTQFPLLQTEPRKLYLSEAWMFSEFGYQRPMSNKKGLKFSTILFHMVKLQTRVPGLTD